MFSSISPISENDPTRRLQFGSPKHSEQEYNTDFLKEKLKKDQDVNYSEREAEKKLRNELTEKKELLIENYEEIVIKLNDQLREMKLEYYEQLSSKEQAYRKSIEEKIKENEQAKAKLSELERMWSDKLNQTIQEYEGKIIASVSIKEVELFEQFQHSQGLLTNRMNETERSLLNKIKEINEQWMKKMNDNDVQLLHEVQEVERVWKTRLEDQQKLHAQEIQAVIDRYSFDKSARELAEQARIEAKEQLIKKQFNKKLKDFEKEVESAKEKYRVQELIHQGALEEARRELIFIQSNVEAKEEALREELSLKDQRLHTIQNRINAADEIATVADMWRRTCKELAMLVIHTCATVQNIPEIPNDPVEDALLSLYPGLSIHNQTSGRTAGYNSDRYTTTSERKQLMELRLLREKNVIVQKKILAKSLRLSKRIIDRLKAEIIVTYD